MKKTAQPVIHIVLFVISLIISLVMFYVTQRQVAAVSKAQAIVDDLATNQSKVEILSNSLPDYKLMAENWARTLPVNEKDVATFASNIEQIAKSLNLSFSLNFDDFPGPVDVSGHYVAGLGAEITLEGSFSSVANFVTRLSDSPYFFKIDKITITKPETKNGVKTVLNGALMMNLKI